MSILDPLARSAATAGAIAALLGAFGCGSREPGERAAPADSAPALERAAMLVLGDVEADEPVRRIRWIEPLAGYLAQRLGDQGIRGGKVVIARDLEEMGRLLAEGEVDLYLDSPFPSVAVRRLSASRLLLGRQVRGESEYWSVFFAGVGSGVRSLEDLRGRVLVLQERNSTSGYLLPMRTLHRRGLEVERVDSLTATVADGRVGGFVGGDEENVIEMVRAGRAVAGVASNQDFEELPAEVKSRLVAIGRSESVPRALVSVRPGMAQDLVERLRSLLLAIDDADRAELAAQVDDGGWSWVFEELSPASRQTLAQIEPSVLERLGLEPAVAEGGREAAR